MIAVKSVQRDNLYGRSEDSNEAHICYIKFRWQKKKYIFSVRNFPLPRDSLLGILHPQHNISASKISEYIFHHFFVNSIPFWRISFYYEEALFARCFSPSMIWDLWSSPIPSVCNFMYKYIYFGQSFVPKSDTKNVTRRIFLDPGPKINNERIWNVTWTFIIYFFSLGLSIEP